MFLLLAKLKIVNNKYILTSVAYNTAFKNICNDCVLLDLNRKFVSATGKYPAASVTYIGTSLFQMRFIEDDFPYIHTFPSIFVYICIYMYLFICKQIFFALYIYKIYSQRTWLKLSTAPNLSQCFLQSSAFISKICD